MRGKNAGPDSVLMNQGFTVRFTTKDDEEIRRIATERHLGLLATVRGLVVERLEQIRAEEIAKLG